MENINFDLDDNNVLTITIDLNEKGTLSKSEKSTVIASTRGNKPIVNITGDELKIGINVFKPVR